MKRVSIMRHLLYFQWINIGLSIKRVTPTKHHLQCARSSYKYVLSVLWFPVYIPLWCLFTVVYMRKLRDFNGDDVKACGTISFSFNPLNFIVLLVLYRVLLVSILTHEKKPPSLLLGFGFPENIFTLSTKWNQSSLAILCIEISWMSLSMPIETTEIDPNCMAQIIWKIQCFPWEYIVPCSRFWMNMQIASLLVICCYLICY